MTYWQLSALINAVMAFITGLFVFIKQRHLPEGRAFVILNIAVFIWAGSYFFWQRSNDISSVLFWCAALNIGAAFTAPAYFHTVVHLLKRWDKMKGWVIVSYSIGLLLSLFMPTPLVEHSVRPFLGFCLWPKAGPLYFFLPLTYFVFSGVALYLMQQDYPNSSQIKKNQLKFMSIAAAVGFLSGATNFPQWYGIEVYPVLNGTVWLYTLIVFYAIIRYRAFEIDTVIHRTALWLATSLWLIFPAYFLFKFTRYWLESLNTLWLTISALGLFYLFLWYYRYFQPKIDHLFRRRKYDYQVILAKVAEKIATTINIEELTQQLLTHVCETMYLRNSLLYVLNKDETKYILVGRYGYKEINGIRQPHGVELFSEEEKIKPLNIPYFEIGVDASLSHWLSQHRKVLEKEQVEVNPEFEGIKEEALSLFAKQEIEIIVSLVLENKVNALLGLGKKENLKAYTLKDIELLGKLGQEVGVTIYNALHYKDLLEKDRLEEEMRLGREIQMNLLPKELPHMANLSISGLMLPAKEIGGDYYDFITLPKKNELGIVIGDVSGKGVGAGLIMATAKATLKGLSQQELSPKQILTQTNNLLYEYTAGSKFMTMLYFQYKANDRALSYSSAGHEHILIYHAKTGQVESIMSGGFMLGMLLDIGSYLEEKELYLEPQDKILLYTDGVTEAESPSGDRFGLERLKESFKTNSQKVPQELILAIKNEVYAFIGSHPQYDDITLIAMEEKE